MDSGTMFYFGIGWTITMAIAVTFILFRWVGRKADPVVRDLNNESSSELSDDYGESDEFEEKILSQRQLLEIMELMNEHKNEFGDTTFAELKDQLRLYKVVD